MGTNTFCRKIKNSVQLASHIGKSFNINQQWWFAKGEKGSKYQEVGKGSSTRVIKNVLRKKKVFNAPQYKEKSEEDQLKKKGDNDKYFWSTINNVCMITLIDKTKVTIFPQHRLQG